MAKINADKASRSTLNWLVFAAMVIIVVALISNSYKKKQATLAANAAGTSETLSAAVISPTAESTVKDSAVSVSFAVSATAGIKDVALFIDNQQVSPETVRSSCTFNDQKVSGTCVL